MRYISRVKWSNPGKGVVLFSTLRCSSYLKGSLLVALDYGHQLYLFTPTQISSALNCKAYFSFEGEYLPIKESCPSLWRNKKQTAKTISYKWSSFTNRDISNNWKKQIWYSSGDIWKTYLEWWIWKLCYCPHGSCSWMQAN